MKNYLTRLTLTPTGSKVSFGNEKPKPSPSRFYHWTYVFRDGSRLVGKVKAQLDPNGKTLVNPSQMVADYLDKDGQTVLMSWKADDFACFEADLDGNYMIIVASNDNFVGNSMCIVESITRTKAQITDSGTQHIAEAMNPVAWSMSAKPENISVPSWEIDWQMVPLFPFMTVSFNWGLPSGSQVYQWTFFPYVSPIPLMQVAKKGASS